MTARPALIAVLLVAGAVGAARADVTLQTRVESDGFKGMGGFAGTTTRSLQGEKSHEDSNVDFKGRLMRAVTVAPGGLQIIRVDLDKVWALNPKKKTYTEHPVSLPPPEPTADKPSSEPGKPAAEEKPTHRIKKSEFTVRKTGEKRTVNGFDTVENEIRLTMEVEEIASKEVTTYRLTTDVWATPWTADLRKASADEARFAQAYAKKLGVNLGAESRRLFDPKLVALMLGVEPSKAESTLADARRKADSIDGYPIVVDARWEVNEDPKAVERRKASQAAAEPEDDPVNLSGGVSGAAGSLFGNLAKKKVRDNQKKKAEENEGRPLFASRTEVMWLSVAAVPADRFDVPAGYKKVSK